MPLQLGREVDVGRVERMSAVLSHRGPDDSGVVVNGSVALANRRLSIVDLAGGHQPMTSADGRLTVSFNGEIYNAPELRRRLERCGRRHRTRCDTEVLLHLHAERGRELVHQLRGCFAFALWDNEARELLLVRDRLGVKPLYYVHDRDGSLWFASEIKALLAAGVVRADVHVPALPGYLAHRATYGEETIFAGVRRLLPGHMLVWRDGEVTVDRYWDIGPTRSEPRRNADHVVEWREAFRESVRLRLMADVPIGVFLSGGIDSSAITAVMGELTGEPVRTFSVGFAGDAPNELLHARNVAEHLRTEHRDVLITPDAFFGALPRLAWHADEPMGHPASVPLYFVALLASRHVKAVLSGEGADETLAGYGRYRTTVHNLAGGRLYERLTSETLRRRIAGHINGRRLSRTFLARPADERNLYFENFAVFGANAQAALLTAEARVLAGGRDPHGDVSAAYDTRPDDDLLNRMLYADCTTYLGALLMKQDKMSMAASVESRVPFLDHELVDVSTRLPSHLKLHHGWNTKHILRASMQGVLPRNVLTRPKLGFPVPIDTWFRGAFGTLLDDYVLGERARRRGLFDHGVVSRLVQEHRAGARHGERLWSLLSFELWARCFLDGEQPDPDAP